MSRVHPAEIRILIVDDDPEVLAGTARLLDKEGYAVDRAADGEEALRLVGSLSPDLVILDRCLPGIQGLEVCRRIKQDPTLAAIFVVIVSGKNTASPDRVEGLEAGADGYIARPIANRELVARVEAYARIIALNRSLCLQTEKLQQTAKAARQAQAASLNLMEDAVEARDRLEASNQELRREITERKHAERALRESEGMLLQAQGIANLGSYVLDVSTGAWRSSAELDRILGIDSTFERSVAGWAALIHPDEGTKIADYLAHEVLGQGQVFNKEYRIIRQTDRAERWVSGLGKPECDAQGRVLRLHATLQDITEKKQLEERFFHAQRLESLGMLAAGIAHDLNNVLAPILFAAPMLRGSLSAPRDLKILNTLESSASRGAALVKQILGFVRTTSGEFRPTQVKHLARDIIDVIQETFPKSIHFEHHIPSDLWPVAGNATQIHQVLMNLCVNARDALPQGGTLRFTVANRRLDAVEAAAIPGARPGAWLVIEVGDTGTGIAPEMLERIWTPFFTTKGAGQGTGLGLSTVRSIVHDHHGFVELHTAVGRGSTFRVFLPAFESEASRAVSDSPFAVPGGRGELILVVDDEAVIRNLVGQILDQHGYRSICCADGVEAIEVFNAHAGEVSVVITDVDMPRLGGLALVQTLLPLYPKLRVIAMSGLSHSGADNLELPGIQNLAHAFLHKPFTADCLLQALHQILHSAATA